jgi:hypothetical protein
MQNKVIIKVFSGTIVSFLIFIAVLFWVNPEKFKILAFVPFYLSLFIFLWGLFFLIRYYFNRLSKNENKNNLYNFTVQSGLLAFLTIGLLLLQHLSYFNIVNLTIFFILIILLEFIISKK